MSQLSVTPPMRSRAMRSHAKYFVAVALFFAIPSQPVWAWQQPLSADELAIATGVALHDNAQISQRSLQSSSPMMATTQGLQDKHSQHPLGQQLLFVELREQKKTSKARLQNQVQRRIAEAFVFDYNAGTTTLKLIDVQSNEIISRTPVPSVHLPLNEAEIEYSQKRVWADTAINELLAVEIEQHFGPSLNESFASNTEWPKRVRYDLSKLQTKVSIWVPGAHVQAPASNCHVQRCALVSLFTKDNYNFSAEPVINLHTGEILLGLVQ